MDLRALEIEIIFKLLVNNNLGIFPVRPIVTSLNTNNIPKDTNTNNSNKYIHQSRRGKQSTLNHDTMSVKEPEHKQNPAIHLSKLLEGEVVVTNSPFNTNKKNPSSGFLFGMESRRGHNLNSNLMKNNVKKKK